MPKVPNNSNRRNPAPDIEGLRQAIQRDSIEGLADQIARGWDLNSLEDRFQKRDRQIRNALEDRARASGRPLSLVKREAIMSALMLCRTADHKIVRRTAENTLLGETLHDRLVRVPDLEAYLAPEQEEPAEEDGWLENANVDLELCLGARLPRGLLRIAWSEYRLPGLSRKERAAELGLQPDTIHKEMGRLRQRVKAARVSEIGLCDECLENLLKHDLSPDAHELVHDMLEGMDLTYEQRDVARGKRLGHSRRLLWEIERHVAARAA